MLVAWAAWMDYAHRPTPSHEARTLQKSETFRSYRMESHLHQLSREVAAITRRDGRLIPHPRNPSRQEFRVHIHIHIHIHIPIHTLNSHRLRGGWRQFPRHGLPMHGKNR